MANEKDTPDDRLGGGDVGCKAHNITNCDMCATENQRSPLPAGERKGADRPATPSSKDQTLLPCPFCGLRPNLIRAFNDPAWWIISCPHADCEVGPTIEREGQDAAIAAWNKRGTVETSDKALLQRIYEHVERKSVKLPFDLGCDILRWGRGEENGTAKP